MAQEAYLVQGRAGNESPAGDLLHLKELKKTCRIVDHYRDATLIKDLSSVNAATTGRMRKVAGAGQVMPDSRFGGNRFLPIGIPLPSIPSGPLMPRGRTIITPGGRRPWALSCRS